MTDMSSMFLNATSFNQPLSLWDTSQVTDMSSMFESAVSFAQPVYFWTGSAATSSSGSTSIFASASSFLEKYSCDSAVDGPVNTHVLQSCFLCERCCLLERRFGVPCRVSRAWLVSDLRYDDYAVRSFYVYLGYLFSDEHVSRV